MVQREETDARTALTKMRRPASFPSSVLSSQWRGKPYVFVQGMGRGAGRQRCLPIAAKLRPSGGATPPLHRKESENADLSRIKPWSRFKPWSRLSIVTGYT